MQRFKHSVLTVTARYFLFLFASLSSSTVLADGDGQAGDAWMFRTEGGYVNQFESSLDAGGDVQADRYFFRLGMNRRLNANWSAGISFGYGETDYDFSGPPGFGGSDPWGKVKQTRLSATLRYRADENWSYIAIPTLRYFEETGADASGRELGLLAAAGYRVSDRLTIGPGFGVFSGLEESTDFFPLLLIDWRITDELSLETGRGLGGTRGPGVSLKWRPMPRWTFSLAARYEKFRFRLNESGVAAGGIGEDKSLPVGLSAEFAPNANLSFTLIGGVELAGSLSLEDRNGNLLEESDFDSAPFFGLLFKTIF